MLRELSLSAWSISQGPSHVNLSVYVIIYSNDNRQLSWRLNTVMTRLDLGNAEDEVRTLNFDQHIPILSPLLGH